MPTKTIYGSQNSDTINVGTINWDAGDNYVIYSYGGNDVLDLYVDGTLWVDAEAGDDDIDVGGSGSATIWAGAGNDTLEHSENYFDDGVVKFYGGYGEDRVTSRVKGADILDGGPGNDHFSLA